MNHDGDAPAHTDGERMLTTQEAAALLHMSVGHFRRLCHKEGVAPHRVRRVGKTRTNLYGYLAIDALRSGRANIDEPIAANTALAVTETHDHARILAVVEQQESVNIELVRIIVLRDQRIAALEAALAARDDRPRRRWWQRRQKEDV